MIQTFFSLFLSSFLLTRHKTSKIIYTETSYIIKLISSIIMIVVYRPTNIDLIIFFIFFLLLIKYKLSSTIYISYRNISGNILVLKFIVLVNVLILGGDKVFSDNSSIILSTLSPNILVNLNKKHILEQQSNIKILFNHISKNCVKSIYKIEIASLISVIASQLLIISIQPRNLSYLLNQFRTSISTKSEIGLIFTFSSQIYYLITDLTNKIIIALKTRASNNTGENLLRQNKILEFLTLYGMKRQYILKHEVMASTQLNGHSLKKIEYSNLEIKKILFFSDKILTTLITVMLLFLLFI